MSTLAAAPAVQSRMGRASVTLLALSCMCASIIAPSSTRIRAEAVGQVTDSAQKLDATDIQKLDAGRAFVRERNARDYAIATPPGIDEGRYVTIGGLEQW